MIKKETNNPKIYRLRVNKKYEADHNLIHNWVGLIVVEGA